jgi:glycosyltransferase 2 family protein
VSAPAQEDSALPPDTATMARGLTRKVMLAALLGGLVFAVLALYGDVRQLRHAVHSVAPAAVLTGFILAAGNYGLRIWRWQYYLRCIGVTIPLFESSIVFLSGFVMSVTPGKVGEVFKSLLLYESRGISMIRTAPIVIAERLTDLIALVLLTALGSLAFEHGVVIAGAGAVLVALMVAMCSYRPFGELCIGLLERIPALSKVGLKLREAYDSLLTMLRPGPLLVGTFIAFCAWALECGSLYAIVRGFPGVALDWDAATFAYSASTIVGALAMLPGGLGVTEAGMTGLLEALGGPAMTKAIATTATILCRLATLWFAVAIGWVALSVYRLRKPDRAAAAQTR